VGVIGKAAVSSFPQPRCIAGWAGCLKRAGIAQRPMHEARDTAITNFLRSSGNLKLAQMLAGHADIGTTANIFAHLDTRRPRDCAQGAVRGREMTGRNRSYRKSRFAGMMEAAGIEPASAEAPSERLQA
jgi:hypothetical protein